MISSSPATPIMFRALLLFVLFLAPIAAQAVDTSDQEAISAVIAKNASAWAAGSGEAFAAQFSDDADYVPPTGDRMHGKQAIASGMQRAFQSFFKDSRLVLKVDSIRFIGSGVAIAHVGAGIVREGQDEAGATDQSLQTYVLAKHDGDWQIEAFQNTFRQPPRGRPK